MGVTKYESRGRTFWMIDVWIDLPDGTQHRYRERKIPTREQAVMKLAKVKIDTYEGRNFDTRKRWKTTVGQIWDLFEPVAKAELVAWKSELARWHKHLKPHFGSKKATVVTLADVDKYREVRRHELTRRREPTTPATRNREVALLRHLLNYGVTRKLITTNPLVGVPMEFENNVRRTVIDEPKLARLLAECSPTLGAIVLAAIDTGMRRGEVLGLRWDQVDLKTRRVELGVQDTKTGRARVTWLTTRAVEAIRRVPRHITSRYVFAKASMGRACGCTICGEASSRRRAGGECRSGW